MFQTSYCGVSFILSRGWGSHLREKWPSQPTINLFINDYLDPSNGSMVYGILKVFFSSIILICVIHSLV
jgi:hypothetical protein